MRGPFRYWRDSLFLVASALYAMNRWLIKPHTDSAFMRGHFNDLLLIPCALPPILWLHRKLALRAHDRPPTGWEIAGHLVAWSLLAEVVGARLFAVTGDPLDVVAYTAGAVAAGAWWWRG